MEMATPMIDDYIRPFEWLTSPASLKDLIERIDPSKILHVGSGSSVVGEHLVETLPSILECVNVDVDESTLHRMKQRWYKKHEADRAMIDRLIYVHADLSCRTGLDQFEDASFDLIVDKSTLDCLLCSENGATGLLTHVYRLLAVGGTYLMVSFHEVSFLQPLLNLPGANWKVQHEVMTRRVENLAAAGRAHGKLAADLHVDARLSTSIDSITSTDDDQGRKLTVNVFQCVKLSGNRLTYEEVHEHILATNSHWYKNMNPMVTSKRIQELRESFGETELLSLPDAYNVMFTNAEREALSYDLFMEDWQAYTIDKKAIESNYISYQTAIDFLEEMQ
ncbi:hypothetical protein MPSEU_000278000 [Mayamaea pseudoterrestris]|nr:hypothetical protein MPSEU_000278000 [Mayamaea pseudoterrestris]